MDEGRPSPREEGHRVDHRITRAARIGLAGDQAARRHDTTHTTAAAPEDGKGGEGSVCCCSVGRGTPAELENELSSRHEIALGRERGGGGAGRARGKSTPQMCLCTHPPEDGVAALYCAQLVACPVAGTEGAPGPRWLEQEVNVLPGSLQGAGEGGGGHKEGAKTAEARARSPAWQPARGGGQG